MHLISRAGFELYETSEKKDKLFVLDPETAAQVNNTMVQETSDRISVAPAGAFTVQLTAVANPKAFTIRMTGPFTVAINGGAALTVNKLAGFTYARVQMDVTLTSLVIGNPGTAAIQGNFCVVGD